MGILAAVASIGGALIGANAAEDAADAQAGAAAASNETQLYMYNQQRADQMPWLEQGKKSLAELATMNATPFQYTEDPGYQFRQTQANKALEASAAAKGGLFSGGTLRNLSTLNQDMASQEYQNAYARWQDKMNRTAAMANVGQSTATNLGQAGQNYANQTQSNNAQSANAQAAAYGTQASLWGNALNNTAQYYTLAKMGAYN